MGGASAAFDVAAATLQLSSVSLNPASVIGANPSTGTVTISVAAPAGGITVTIASDNPSVAATPASVTVAQGQTTAAFTVTTTAVAVSTAVTLSAAYNGVTRTAVLTVLPPPALSALTLAPAGVTGGSSASGTITLTSMAPSGGVLVTLSSSSPGVATLPANVTVTAGQTTATVTVSTTAVTAQTAVTISAVYNGVTKTATLNVYPPNLASFSISPNATSQGRTVTGTLGLDGPAPAGGAAVAVTCSNAQAALFPATVSVGAGQTATTFAIGTSTVNFPITVTFTAVFNSGQPYTATLTLTPGNLHVTDIRAPYTVNLTWDCQAAGSFLLKRDGVTLATLANTVTTYADVFIPSFSNGQIYYYEIFDSSNPATHLSASKVVPYQIAASDNQAVDSRLDLRYSTNVFLDHLFGATVYRGGLFAGLNNDGSRVGRSYAKFSLQAPAAGLDFRVGNLDAYCTGAATSGNAVVQMQVACQAITDTSWLGSSMVWSTPANLNLNLDPAAARAAVIYNPALPNPAPGWLVWPMHDSIRGALSNVSQPYSVALTSASEATSGWAYFAKKEYDPLLSPCAAYAWEVPIPILISFTPTPITGGGDVTCSLIVNGVGLGDSVVVSLSQTPSTTTTVTGFPSSVTVTGLARSFTFHVETPPGGCIFHPGPPPFYTPVSGPGGSVTVTATCNGVSGSATLVINPYPAPATCP